MTDLTVLKRRRGVAKASITRLTTKVAELEAKDFELSVATHAQQLLKKLDTLDNDFNTQHLNIIDALESEEHLEAEQEVLDKHDDDVTELSLRLQALCSHTPVATGAHPDRTIVERRLAHLQARLMDASADVSKLTPDHRDIHLIHLYQEQLSEFRREHSNLRNETAAITADLADRLYTDMKAQDKLIFDMSVEVTRLLYNPTLAPDSLTPTTPGPRGMKLPKIEVPTFDGDLLQWQTFWEQFSIAIDSRTDISDTEKLVYLRLAIKAGSAKSIVEGLSHTGDQYKEAVASLKSRYNRPRLIHQTHVKKICEVYSLKEGSGRELRRLHDTVIQHLRALKAMGQEPSGSFITSMLELKLDKDTMFEWQRASQGCTETPHCDKLLEFLDLRAQASETCATEPRKPFVKKYPSKSIAAFSANASEQITNCTLCKTEKHPMYSCPRFKSLPHEKMLTTVRSGNLCLNCLRPGHISKNCVSNNRCRRCQRPHHTLLHSEAKTSNVTKELDTQVTSPVEQQHSSTVAPVMITSNTQAGAVGKPLMMTCQVLIHAPDGSSIRARGLLDSGSTTSFVSERLAQSLRLPRSSQPIKISGIAGISHKSPLHSVATFKMSPVLSPKEKMNISAIVVPRVTCDLPIQLVHHNPQWNHLSGLQLADPEFGQPGKIDLLLGIDIYTDVLLQGRRNGPFGSPTAFETKFGWVLAGRTNAHATSPQDVAIHHVAVETGDDILRKFWELEENPRNPALTPEEKTVVQHFEQTHSRNDSGRFVVPLPKGPHAKPLGESRSQAVRRFLSLERTLHSKKQFKEFSTVMEEYIEMKHAEAVPTVDLQKPSNSTFYLPMHAVRKEHSTTTKLRVVFDASAKSSSGVSLNDTLLVGPTVHPPLIDVLLHFRTHRIALTTDVSKMYRAVELAPTDKDLHRFVWRSNPKSAMLDYRMTRVTFGVSASSFAANMSVKQNAHDFEVEYPQAAQAVKTSFYVDDGLTGADSVSQAIQLQRQLQDLFMKGGFLLRKWNSSNPQVLQHLSPELKDTQPSQMMPSSEQYTKTLGIEWNASKDHFRLTISEPPQLESITKRGLVSDVAKTFDVLGWFSPSTIKVKILMQQLWEHKIDWDDPVPSSIRDAWSQWRSELHMLSQKHLPRCYFDKSTDPALIEMHGFSDASEAAYSAVVYLRITDKSGNVQTSLVSSKTKVAPIKRLSIPRLELCGAQLLAQLMHHIGNVLKIPLNHTYAWTDSTIVINWLDGSPKRFKTYVGNRISTIVDLIPPDKWRHVNGLENPADCASRGLYPSELL